MKPEGNHLRRWIIALAVVLVLALVKIFLLPSQASEARGGRAGGKGGGKGGGKVVSVQVMVVQPRELREQILATGTTLASEDVVLKNEAGGRVVRIAFTEGGTVKKGDLLVKINDADLQAQKAKAQANLAVAKEKETRQKSLFDKGSISPEEYELAANVLALATADLSLLEAQIAKTEVRAPFAGTIGLRQASEGDYLPAGASLANLVAADPLKIEFSVPEKYFERVRRGAAITFTVQGITGERQGKIYAGEAKVDPATRTVRFRAVAANPGNRIPAGAFARVELELGDKKSALLVPSECLVPDFKGQSVYVVKGGVALYQPVTTGIRGAAEVEITAGLSFGDSVVTRGVLLLRPGAVVEIPAGDTRAARP